MNVANTLVQTWLRQWAPAGWAALTRLAYAGDNIVIGKNLRVDGVPRLLVDPGARVRIGDNVELRSGVEIRVHGTASLEIASNVRIDRGVRLLASNSARVMIGSGSRIGLGSVLNGGDSITVEQDALISGYVYLQTSMHRFESVDQPIKDQHYDHGPVVVGEGAWIAAHVVVMPGVTIGAQAVVGSNAVVTRDVNAWAVVGGVPAREIKKREGG